VGGLSAGLAGANAQGGAQAGQNVALNNDAPHWGLPSNQAQAGLPGQQGGSTNGSSLIANPFTSAGAAACAGGLQPCNMQVFQAAMQAQGVNSDQALANMQTAAPYVGGTLGVALLGPEALTAAVLAGGFDYEGDAVSYAANLSKDPPSFTKSYIAGVVGGLTYPFGITDEAIAGMGTAGKIAANGYNAVVTGTGAFGAAAITHQDSPDASAGFGAGSAAFGGAVKSLFPGSVGSFLNNMIQGLAGPFQNAVMPSK
jgi:filamentous hemagglutinin